MLREEPYTQKEADIAVGLRTDNGVRASGGAEDALTAAAAATEKMEVQNQ